MTAGVRFSVAYAKLDSAVFFSHLDTLRIFDRALRRTGIETCFTQGCNPHIRLSMYTAIPLGLETEGEWISLKLVHDMEPEILQRLLNRELPPGFSVVQAIRGKPPISDPVDLGLAAFYAGRREEAEAAAARLMDQARIEIKGTKKGRPFIRDVRPFFKNYEVDPASIVFRLQESGPCRPKLGEIAKGLYALSSSETLTVDRFRIIKAPSSMESAAG